MSIENPVGPDAEGVFCYRRRIHFYETDAMGVVHHSNYIRLFEEARVAMMRERKLTSFHYPEQDLVFAVLETQCRHFKPAYFDDEAVIQVQVRLDGSKIRFEYRLFTSRYQKLAADGMSLHILVDKNLKVRKPPNEMRSILEREVWTETWRSNL